jgi:hypothetical protein
MLVNTVARFTFPSTSLVPDICEHAAAAIVKPLQKIKSEVYFTIHILMVFYVIFMGIGSSAHQNRHSAIPLRRYIWTVNLHGLIHIKLPNTLHDRRTVHINALHWTVFWDVTLCSPAELQMFWRNTFGASICLFYLIFNTEEGGNTLLWNTGKLLLLALHSRQQ